jgi:hypothetical protein
LAPEYVLMTAAACKIEVTFFLVDVFSDKPLEGNPVAIVPDAARLTECTMHQIAREFLQPDAWDRRRCGDGNRGRSARVSVSKPSCREGRKHIANRTVLRHGAPEFNPRARLRERSPNFRPGHHLRQGASPNRITSDETNRLDWH